MSLDLSASFVGVDGNIEAVEEWRVIPELDGRYEASSLGRIRHAATGNIRKPYHNTNGYLMFSTKTRNKVNGKNQYKTLYVHRAVLSAFDPIDGWENLQVNHKDFDTHNCALSNLEWLTAKQNQAHSRRSGRHIEADKKRSERALQQIKAGTSILLHLTPEQKAQRYETRKRRTIERKQKQAA